MLRHHRLLLKRVGLLGVIGIIFWQWLSFSLDFGMHPANIHESEYDHLFHKHETMMNDSDDSKLQFEVEAILKASKDEPPPTVYQVDKRYDHRIANLTFDITGLEELFVEDWHWRWISMRVHQLWPELCEAVKELQRGDPSKFENRTMLRITVVPGVLSLTDFAHPDRVFHGGPLGELTQWADVIAVLYLLGHQLQLRWDVRYVGKDLAYLAQEQEGTRGCASKAVDLVYTDLGGHSNMPDNVKDKYRLKFRILDAFGTEVMYNNVKYAKSNNLERSAGMRGLYIKQFFTMYPEVPDNSFAGFIISKNIRSAAEKENIGIIYGKDPKYLRGKTRFIKTLQQFMEVHTTMPWQPNTNNQTELINHGVVKSEEYQAIVAKAKYFIGLGDPIEGPGILEALARGCIVIQPKLRPDYKLQGKPNNRTLSSQVPYLERIGPPNAFTLNYSNITHIEQVIRQTQNKKVSPMLPMEFSAYGYIDRLNTYLEKQTYCPFRKQWPPRVALHIKISSSKPHSCSQVCQDNDMVCETNLFDYINSSHIFTDLRLHCAHIQTISEVYAPAYLDESKTCLLQNDNGLYSCASYNSGDVLRICPCRTFYREQRALCKECG